MPTYLYPCMIKLRRKSHNLSQTLLYWASKQPFALCSFKASYNVCPMAIPELFSQTQGSNYWQLMPSSNITKGILTFINTLNPFTVLGGLGVKQNLFARQRAIESLMIIRLASQPSFNFCFVQEQESISITKKDKTLINVSDIFFL